MTFNPELEKLKDGVKAQNLKVEYLEYGNIEVECPQHPGNFVLVEAKDIYGQHAPVARVLEQVEQRCYGHKTERDYIRTRWPEGAEQ